MFHTNKRKSQGLTIDLQCCTDSFPRRTICLRHCNFVDKTVSIIFTSTTHTTINSLLLLGNRFPQVCNVSRRPENFLLRQCTTLYSLLLLRCPIFFSAMFFDGQHISFSKASITCFSHDASFLLLTPSRLSHL